MSMIGFVQTLILCILLPCWGQASPISSLREPRSFSGELGMADQSMLDQDDKVDVQTLLNQFLSMLNLTEQEPQSRSQADHIETPEYMLELYNHYVNDRRTRPDANIARSFKNEDTSPYSVTTGGVRTHPLMFNVSIPHHEHIIAAELRLFMLIRPDPQHYNRVNWKVTIFEMETEGRSLFEGMPETNALVGTQQLLARYGQSESSGWEVFDMTDTAKKWRQSESTNHWLELHIESVNDVDQGNQIQNEKDGVFLIHLDIEQNSGGKHEPVLIVFSDKDHPGHMTPEDNNGQLNNIALFVDENEEHKQHNEALSTQIHSNRVYKSAPRTRRHAKESQCKRTPLYVDFKDIGWDSWVVAPPGYDAYACHGECTFPLLPQTTPTKHALVQTLVNLKSSQRVSRACCVPTKLEPISMLYHENGHVIFQNKYEGMVVAECGCR
ncbi:bone morphogenetic protein 10-like [Trichomycterus rosablanca]|uniref:bone morphogenetic protein 10-like n=1 Tax=Trichomycterus rosablanca TaxID=2290929 RepID=UPI002F35A165